VLYSTSALVGTLRRVQYPRAPLKGRYFLEGFGKQIWVPLEWNKDIVGSEVECCVPCANWPQYGSCRAAITSAPVTAPSFGRREVHVAVKQGEQTEMRARIPAVCLWWRFS